jgi:hypothetical protein
VGAGYTSVSLALRGTARQEKPDIRLCGPVRSKLPASLLRLLHSSLLFLLRLPLLHVLPLDLALDLALRETGVRLKPSLKLLGGLGIVVLEVLTLELVDLLEGLLPNSLAVDAARSVVLEHVHDGWRAGPDDLKEQRVRQQLTGVVETTDAAAQAQHVVAVGRKRADQRL